MQLLWAAQSLCFPVMHGYCLFSPNTIKIHWKYIRLNLFLCPNPTQLLFAALSLSPCPSQACLLLVSPNCSVKKSASTWVLLYIAICVILFVSCVVIYRDISYRGMYRILRSLPIHSNWISVLLVNSSKVHMSTALAVSHWSKESTTCIIMCLRSRMSWTDCWQCKQCEFDYRNVWHRKEAVEQFLFLAVSPLTSSRDLRLNPGYESTCHHLLIAPIV